MVRQAWRLRDVEEPTVEQLRELRADDLVDPDEPVVPPLPDTTSTQPSANPA